MKKVETVEELVVAVVIEEVEYVAVLFEVSGQEEGNVGLKKISSFSMCIIGAGEWGAITEYGFRRNP